VTAPAVIRATFTEWRMVKTRSALQIVLEVPIEQTEEVLATLGAPMPGKEKWVAVALLDAKAVARQVDPGGASTSGRSAPAETEKPRRKFTELRLSAQAGILCEQDDFRGWLAEEYPNAVRAASGDIAGALRLVLKVQSRTELDDARNTRERAAWSALLTQFQQETGRMARDPRDTAA
tara:strand:+ start:19205 stop:19738 length:534 start_codon:yes stop_codon:yes gene_type:complete